MYPSFIQIRLAVTGLSGNKHTNSARNFVRVVFLSYSFKPPTAPLKVKFREFFSYSVYITKESYFPNFMLRGLMD